MPDRTLTSRDFETHPVSPALVFVALVAAVNLASALASLAMAA
jgi:hypothetical protein